MESEKEIYPSINVKKRVSIVWTYFVKLNRDKVRCKFCGHEQNYQGTTGNILRHLKNKHNIDATIKGQSENPGIAEAHLAELELVSDKHNESEEEEFLSVRIKTESNDVNSTFQRSLREREARNKVITYCEEQTDVSNLDPYVDSTIDFGDYVVSNETKTREINRKSILDSSAGFNKEKSNSIEETRLLAEIEYFRQKAAYYRMQKNLTALQAKKVKYELDKL